MAGHPGAEHGVVGAHIGIVGRDVEASDQNVIDAVAGRGEREQRERRPSGPVCACPISARLHRRRRRGGAAGGSAAGAPAPRRGGADGLFRDMEPSWSASGGSVARNFAFRRFRLGTKDACGLVSRCGHHGLPNCNVAMRCAARNRPLPPRQLFKLSLTERFGQGILISTRPYTASCLPRRIPGGNLSGKAKPMVAAQPTHAPPRRRRGHLEAPPDSRRRAQGVHGSRLRRRQHGRDRPLRRRFQGHALRLLRRQEPAVRSHRRGGIARTGQDGVQFRSRTRRRRPR